MIDKLTRVLPVLHGLGGMYILLALLPGVAAAQGTGTRYLNPKGLVTPTGYTHVVVAPDGRTVYIAGQVAFGSTGKVVGEGDFAAQAEPVFRNLELALAILGSIVRH